jgi:hypothetical protein
MTRLARSAASVALVALFGATGCNPPASPTTNREPEKKNADVHIRTPGASVDVEHKRDGKSVDVDVRRK